MLATNKQEVTAFHLVSDHQPLLVYLGIREDGVNKILKLEATIDDETNKTFFQTTVSLKLLGAFHDYSVYIEVFVIHVFIGDSSICSRGSYCHMYNPYS